MLTSPFCRANEVQPAVALQISVESDVSPDLARQLSGILRSALAMVQMFPPPGYENNLFHWVNDRSLLEGKEVRVVLTTSRNQTLAPLLANSGASGTDAFTLAPMNLVNKTMPIFVVLLVDKIFYNSAGLEQENAFAKLVVALAHEIYGNVQHFLEFDMDGAKPQTRANRVDQQRNAFRASLMFLAGLKEDPRSASLPPGIYEGLEKLLPSEIRGFRSWQRAHPSESPDPACEALLASLAGKN